MAVQRRSVRADLDPARRHPGRAGPLAGGGGDSGFDFTAIGTPRADALAATRRFTDRDPLLGVMWRSAPTGAEVMLDRAD
ncbi:hypothetical protein ACIOG8_35430 [Streptomyces erythrochromogenes]|uniref:hypothetical protein n=1 Tax=Streptomyces erythrochromogenes TaxID=285574 RepID=UPI0037F896A1